MKELSEGLRVLMKGEDTGKGRPSPGPWSQPGTLAPPVREAVAPAFHNTTAESPAGPGRGLKDRERITMTFKLTAH